MITEAQIREKLGRYLRDESALDRFEDWLAENSWNMHKDSAEEAQKLASAIELRLAEHSAGHLNEQALRDELRQFANPPVVQILFGEASPIAQLELASVTLAHARAQVFSFIGRIEPRPQEMPSLEEAVSFDRQQLAGCA